jgi:hypothetical protein
MLRFAVRYGARIPGIEPATEDLMPLFVDAQLTQMRAHGSEVADKARVQEALESTLGKLDALDWQLRARAATYRALPEAVCHFPQDMRFGQFRQVVASIPQLHELHRAAEEGDEIFDPF